MSGRLSQATKWLLVVATENAGEAVYGALMIGVLLAAEDARHEGYGATIEAAALVLALYWLTRIYADTLGSRLGRRRRLDAALLWRSCVHELPILEGALIPTVALLVAWAAGFAVTSGVTAALWATVASIVVLELAAGWRSRGRRGIWLEAVASATLGLALIALKLVLH
jgi:MFS family permease